MNMVAWFKGLDTRHKIILIYLAIALFYTIVLSWLLVNQFNALPIVAQFILGTVPVFVLFSIVLGGTKNYRRLIASFLFFLAADIVVLGTSASNMFFLSIVQSFNQNELVTNIITSVVLPTIFVAIAVYLLNDKEVKKEFTQ